MPTDLASFPVSAAPLKEEVAENQQFEYFLQERDISEMNIYSTPPPPPSPDCLETLKEGHSGFRFNGLGFKSGHETGFDAGRKRRPVAGRR